MPFVSPTDFACIALLKGYTNIHIFRFTTKIWRKAESKWLQKLVKCKFFTLQHATVAAIFPSQKDKELVFAWLFWNRSAPTTPSRSPASQSWVNAPRNERRPLRRACQPPLLQREAPSNCKAPGTVAPLILN